MLFYVRCGEYAWSGEASNHEDAILRALTALKESAASHGDADSDPVLGALVNVYCFCGRRSGRDSRYALTYFYLRQLDMWEGPPPPYARET